MIGSRMKVEYVSKYIFPSSWRFSVALLKSQLFLLIYVTQGKSNLTRYSSVQDIVVVKKVAAPKDFL